MVQMGLYTESREIWLARVKAHKTHELDLEPQSQGEWKQSAQEHAEVKTTGQNEVNTKVFLKRKAWAIAMRERKINKF